MRIETTRLLNQMHPAAFSYDHQNGAFQVAEQSYAPEDVSLRFGALSTPEPTLELPDAALIHTLTHPVMMPKMYDWLAKNGTDELFDETSEVMRDVFQTRGNCACLGVDLHGIIGERYWDDKIAEFTFHNTDTKPQQISLLAGLGHIAHRVNS